MAELTEVARQSVTRSEIGCSLQPQQLAAQLARYEELGRHAVSVDRAPSHVLARFADPPPAPLLDQIIDVERRCCPSIQITYNARRRELMIAVKTVAQGSLLHPLFEALAP